MTSLQSSDDSGAHLYGTQSSLALDNFGSIGRKVGEVPSFVRSFAEVKLAAVRANRALGVIDAPRAEAIEQACREVAAGEHHMQFPTALVLGGGGTTTNMNFNEVIAARATQIAKLNIHPNDHVNASQSTNDVYPTAMALTVLDLSEAPVLALLKLANYLEVKGCEYERTERLGRTCLQDAVTLTVGQTHASHAAAVKRVAGGLSDAVSTLCAVPIGATVLGTGIGAPAGYAALCVEELSTISGRRITSAVNFFDALSNLDAYAAIAAAGTRAAIVMAKIAADLRFLASGPIGGINEVVLPIVQAGSSIMPAKNNPVIPEFVMQLSYRIRGRAHTVECAVAAGELELNVMEPVIIDSLIDIFEDLTVSADIFAQRCIAGLRWDGPRLKNNLAGAFDRWVEMAAISGYEHAAREVQVAQRAVKDVAK
jgi:aspartate ammonia-lyase